ncbi:hypothetical protein CALCODRAFT_14112 [Calocera cornea HHB12733]|uniref:Zn(2)-C6 fungal-type domain-containing protein n=1 Tax=Calocera cornea HHB12733 TaxID=1353952 RepID=A0A165EAC6_9BASI|nr:hypothetical protein CALCODRAFT_14112 [Calocera cornea HHB12733]
MEGQHTGQFNPAPPQFAWTGQEPIPPQQQQQQHQSPYPQQQDQTANGHQHKQGDVTFTTWDYLEQLSDPSLLPQHLPHPHLRVDISQPAQQAGHLLTPASTHASSPGSASTTASAMPFSIPGVPALSPGGSPSTSSSMEPLPPRIPMLPNLGAQPTAPAYNPYPYQNHQYGGTMTSTAGYGGLAPSFDNTMFIKQTLPCGRQRIEQACEKCRERKARCNGGRPTCARCLQRGYECNYAPERRMRGPNRLKNQSSKGIQPRTSLASLSGSVNSRDSRDGRSPTSTGTGTPSPTEEKFGVGPATGAPQDAQAPRKVASLGNLTARLARPADGSRPSPSSLVTMRHGMSRSSSSAMLHERSLSNGSRHSGKTRLSVEAPPETDSAGSGSGAGTPSLFTPAGRRAPAPGTLGLNVRPEHGLGMPTFPDPPMPPAQMPYGFIPPTAYLASAQQHAQYLPGIPGMGPIASDFTPTTEGVQYLAYPYGIAYPSVGMHFPQDGASPEGGDAAQLLTAKGYGGPSHGYGSHDHGIVGYGSHDHGIVKPQPMSPAQLAYMTAMVDDRGHSR